MSGTRRWFEARFRKNSSSEVGHIFRMGVVIERVGGEHYGPIPDPNGGLMGAAGDFDPVLRREWDRLPFLSHFDPYVESVVPRVSMELLIGDIDHLDGAAATHSEGSRGARQQRRGLARFRALAEFCRDTPDTHLRLVGSWS